MKHLTSKLLALALLALVYSSCSDDDGPPGKFTISSVEGKTFKINRAFAHLDSSTPSGDDTYYVWEIFLTSNGITWDSDELDFTGTGDAVTLTVYPKNDDSFLPVGTYHYNQETAYSNGVYINYNVDEEEGEVYDGIDDATVTITKSGNTFTITFTITLDNATVITGSYKGSVTELEE